FFSLSFLLPRDLHSFPTRRSSDLGLFISLLDFGTGRSAAGIGGWKSASEAMARLRSRRSCPGNRSHLRPTQFSRRILRVAGLAPDRKSTRLNSSHQIISYAVFCLK